MLSSTLSRRLAFGSEKCSVENKPLFSEPWNLTHCDQWVHTPKQPWEHLSLRPAPQCVSISTMLPTLLIVPRPPLNPNPRQQNRCLVTDRGGKGADCGFAFAMEGEVVPVSLAFSPSVFSGFVAGGLIKYLLTHVLNLYLLAFCSAWVTTPFGVGKHRTNL